LRWPSLIPVTASLVIAGVVWFQTARKPIATDEFAVSDASRGISRTIPKGNRPAWFSFQVHADAPSPPYECDIADATGKVLENTTLEAPATRVLVHRERLKAGSYSIVLRKDGNTVAQYPFQIQ
jgi:hypothetical protein